MSATLEKIFRLNVASTTVDAEVFFFLIISKNLPLKGKFFEMVSRALPPGGGLGGFAPRTPPRQHFKNFALGAKFLK